MALEALKRNGHNLHIGEFEPEGKYGVPSLCPVRLSKRIDWLPFNCAKTDKRRSAHGIHFFVDDYLFERVWNDPERYALLLSDFRAVMTPDFSLFTDYPLPVQLYNHWRKHLLGAYWQSRGITVIPSICWSDEASFDWCFDGEPVGGTVAVSSVGTQKNPEARILFLSGYREMMERLKDRVHIIHIKDGSADGHGTPLGMGEAHIVDADGQRRRAACMGGLLSVLDGEVRLVATTWEWAEEIDQARAEASKKRAEEILAQKNLDKRDYELAQARLKRALVRTSVR